MKNLKPFLIIGILCAAVSTTAQSTPRDSRATTFYESFEAWTEADGLDWIPDGWTEINTPANIPTAEMLSHNINKNWFVYFSSDFFQDPTPDGEKEAFIHFPYDEDEGAVPVTSDAKDEWLVTPPVTLASDETLHFLLQADLWSVYDVTADFDWSTMTFRKRVKVNTLKVMVTDDNGATWSCLWDLVDDICDHMTDKQCYDNSTTLYRPYDVDLTAYAGKTVKLAFRYICDGGGRKGNNMYLDRVLIDHPVDAGVSAILSGDTDIPAEYYDLRGHRVDYTSAAPGIYIERRGSRVSKTVKR